MKSHFRFVFFVTFGLLFFDNHGFFAQNNSDVPDNVLTANCVFYPEAIQWGIETDWSSVDPVSPLVIPLVGDINGDGIPEIVCFAPDDDYSYYGVTKILIFSTLTHEVIHEITMPNYVSGIDAAPYGLVKLHNGHVIMALALNDRTLVAYDLTVMGTQPIWTAATNHTAPNVAFADFNGDGYPEIYVGQLIYDAETGVMLVDASTITNSGSACAHNSTLPSPIAANVVGDNRSELILGNEVYEVNITNRTGQNGNSINLVQSCTPPEGIGIDGHPQVADFNMDGYLDVFISNKTSSSADNVGCYVWDIHNNTVSQPLLIPTSGRGKSIPLIADIDDDELLEMVIQSRVYSDNKVQAYKFDYVSGSFSMIWDFEVDEDSFSNSLTSFDFNHDDRIELLISDQSSVKIVNASGKSHVTGNDTIPVYTITSMSFGECTVMQYPVIADVDADGSAEIVAVGLFGSGHTYRAYLNVFHSAGVPWAPARKVWNQYMYNVTNVNEDLSIPAYVYNNATAFEDQQGVIRRPFNNFLQQATTINPYGQAVYGVADVEALSANISDQGEFIELAVEYINKGDAAIIPPYGITVFANSTNGQVIQTFIGNDVLQIGQVSTQTLQLSKASLCHMPDLDNLVVAINCMGNGIGQNGNLQPECDVTNNEAQVPVNVLTEPINVTQESCGPFVWNGQTYSESGIYTYQTQTQGGCDSTVVLNLTVGDRVSRDISAEACNMYNWHGQDYTESGVYSYLIDNPDGCDTIVYLTLTINHGPNLDIDGPTKIYTSTSITTGIYVYSVSDTLNLEPNQVQWSCSNPDWILTPLGNGFRCRLTVTTIGTGELTASVNDDEDCDAFSVIRLNAIFLHIEETMASAKLYPNPTKSKITIEADQIVQVRMVDVLGQVVANYECEMSDAVVCDVSHLPQGIYIVEVNTQFGRIIKRLVVDK